MIIVVVVVVVVAAAAANTGTRLQSRLTKQSGCWCCVTNFPLRHGGT